MSTVVRITPQSTVLVLLTRKATEPGHGSIVMTQGLTGTAWQRFFHDGSWHSTTGQVAETWDDLWDEHVGTKGAGVTVILDVPLEPGL